jgi:hypothetical protein
MAWLCCANHQALSCRFYNLPGDRVERVDLYKPGDLREEPVEQAEVSPSHADNRRACLLIRDAFRGSCHSRWDPLPLEEVTHLGGTQRTKRMDEAHS